MLLSSAAVFLGGWIFRHGAGSKQVAIDDLLMKFAIGINVVAFIGIVLGQLRLLKGWNSVLLLVGISLLSLWKFTGFRGLVSQASEFRRPHSRTETIADHRNMFSCCLVSLIALLTMGPALAYPDGWDELVYHATLPRRWLVDGWPSVYFDLPYSAFPSLSEILFWLVSPIDFVFVPRLMSWMCWCVALILLIRILQRFVAINHAIALAMAFGLSNTLLMVVNNCYVESVLTMNFAAMLFLMIRPDDSVDDSWTPSWSVALGILAGGATA